MDLRWPPATAFPLVEWLPLRRNVGFARAVNLAAERLAYSGDVEILTTLNPDTAPEPTFLAHLVAPICRG